MKGQQDTKGMNSNAVACCPYFVLRASVSSQTDSVPGPTCTCTYKIALPSVDYGLITA